MECVKRENGFSRRMSQKCILFLWKDWPRFSYNSSFTEGGLLSYVQLAKHGHFFIYFGITVIKTRTKIVNKAVIVVYRLYLFY